MKAYILLAVLLTFFMDPQSVLSDVVRLGIVQDKRVESPKYKSLRAYLAVKGIKTEMYCYTRYSNAATAFREGYIGIMFAGSGIAAALIEEGLAEPLVRPNFNDGFSTYGTVLIAPSSSAIPVEPKRALTGRRVAACGYATAGELYFLSVMGDSKGLIKTRTHSEALRVVSKGSADLAVVKNSVWKKSKSEYNKLKKVGEDKEQHPNGTLIFSTKGNPKLKEELTKALLDLEDDKSPEAQKVKEIMKITGFVTTSKEDFTATFKVLEKARQAGWKLNSD